MTQYVDRRMERGEWVGELHLQNGKGGSFIHPLRMSALGCKTDAEMVRSMVDVVAERKDFFLLSGGGEKLLRLVVRDPLGTVRFDETFA